MTFADENRYPPSETGWPPPHPGPRAYRDGTPRYASYGQAPWDEPHAHDAHRRGVDLAALRSAYRLLRRTSTLAALGSFVVYVVLSCYAPGLMGAGIAGELSLGTALGVLQLLVTFAAVFWYGRSAQRSVDPLARNVREQAVATGRTTGVTR
ncbi:MULTISPECIES: DUF485 domain-containing protein [unclassified Streptomyces]|uniref:DUF485 domain-containing protein n=1 Tax=unclassified Streptomyces TaxID=2593676 RepID=UPI001F03B24C|nr:MULTISPECIES: DUF485 domain-containing protein [unclassified Streptomyces]MCH0564212.1 DUF485 domain-containing protein [Streptomyces sp. MUM 2J]MCH0568514.1 DUF485 domain-containing protein [Streptomyces sp. MUM 136J]